ncbi:hypothetical protein F4557_007457 [Actinomadura catellatispora]|uniref:Uncharacterized protein n=1 Tax=Actinomadura livida TaxID=79909 RepID=A0A7W7IKZ9_9ACTN|nr:hypothetical protein [Actinomadura catellatispora]
MHDGECVRFTVRTGSEPGPERDVPARDGTERDVTEAAR